MHRRSHRHRDHRAHHHRSAQSQGCPDAKGRARTPDRTQGHCHRRLCLCRRHLRGGRNCPYRRRWLHGRLRHSAGIRHRRSRQLRHAHLLLPAWCLMMGSATAITNKIRRLRFDHDEMTQQELAERVGVTRQTVNAIELGKYSPSLEVAFRIARVFGVPLEEVFQYDDARTSNREEPR
ncbi:MAG: transcriptional regulator [Gammaproteobacteria bacterium]|nr:MAG: transcriptional regulator [Gammaproteobacteria bacterium]